MRRSAFFGAPLLLLGLEQGQAQAHPRDIVRSITSAIDAGKADSARRHVEAAARRRPADPAAQFALATIDRLSYRHRAADARLVALSGTLSPPWRAWALLGLGMSRIQRWDPTGVSVLWGAVAAADSIAEPDLAATALLGLSRYLARFVPADSTARLVARARGMVPSTDTSLMATALCADAGTRLRSSAFAAADTLTGRAIVLAISSRDRRSRARCLLTAYQVASARGRQKDALDRLREARWVVDSTGDADLSATIRQQWAFHLVQYSYGLAEAREEAQRAVTIGDRIGNRVVTGYARLNLAQVAVRLGDYRAAGHQLDSARAVLDALGDRSGRAAADFVAGDAALALGRFAVADAAYRASMAGYRAVGTPVVQVSLRLAMLALEQGDVTRADQLLQEVAAETVRFSLRGIQSDLVYYRALLTLKQGRPLDAAAGFRRYREGVARDAFLYRFDAGMREAEALAIGGRLDEAIVVADSSFAMLEGMRLRLKDVEEQANRDVLMALASTRRFEFDPDLGVATLVNRLAVGGRVSSAFRLADAERARTLWVRMARRGMLGQDSPAAVPRTRITSSSDMALKELQGSLDSSTAILEFIGGVGEEPTTLFAVGRDTLHVFSLPPTDRLADPIRRFTDIVEGGGYPRTLARDLGRVLLDSAVAALPRTVSRLVIVPDGPLYRIPFDAVILAPGDPLVQRFLVSTAPSGRMAVEWLSATDGSKPGRVLAFGDPRFATALDLPRLPGSAREARIAAGAGGLALVGAKAGESELKGANWTDVTVLHLATHARTEDIGILSSAIYLAPSGADDGYLRPEEIAMRAIPVDLVVLSGCRTIGGAVVFGEGIQGLVSPFLEAGAQAVLATYWEVGDRRIIPLVERFYAELRRGRTAGEALRLTKLASLRAGQPPATWAAFALTGNPDVRPLGRATGP